MILPLLRRLTETNRAADATKYAVVALSESLANDLADTPIGVSVLAPAAVNTQIYRSGENRPARFGGPLAMPGHGRLQEELKHGLGQARRPDRQSI